MPKRFGNRDDSASVQVPGMLGVTSRTPQPTHREKSVGLTVAVYKQSTDEK